MSAQAMRRVRRALVPAVIGGAAVVTVAAVGGVAVVSPESVASTMHGLTTLIGRGSSTHPAGESIEDFYRRNISAGRDSAVTINFYTGPLGIDQALTDDATGAEDVVLSAGRDAAVSLANLEGARDTHLPSPDPAPQLLHHDDDRPNGGFTARVPTLETTEATSSPVATPPGSDVIDVGFEYGINGNAPAYVFNGFSVLNWLVAHLGRQPAPGGLDLPVSVDANGTVVVREGCETGCQTADGFARLERIGRTTYVSYESADLPLTRPLRRHGGPAGARIADVVDPALRTVVDFGYTDNDPLAARGSSKPARLVPTVQETREFGEDLVAAVREGVRSLDASEESGNDTRRNRRSESAAPARKGPQSARNTVDRVSGDSGQSADGGVTAG